MSKKALAIAAATLCAAIALHELAAHWLSGTTLVAALLSPAGAGSTSVLVGAVLFIGLRFVLLVLAPGVISAAAAVAVGSWVRPRRGRTRA
jgi:hypothetical protein